jgi:hypothetical protein
VVVVADANTGRIYYFKLNDNRTELQLHGVLQDKIANNTAELNNSIFSQALEKWWI